MSLLTAAALVLTTVAVAGLTGCTSSADSYDANAPKDFGGRVFRIGAWWDRSPVEGTTAWDDAFAARIREVEADANCRVEFVTVADTDNAYVTSTLAGAPVCDIATALTRNLLPSYIHGGIAYPLSDLASFDFTENKWLPSALNFGRYKGKTYVMDIRSAPENCVRFGVFYNKRIFAEQRLPDLEVLYDSGAWNWNKMLEVARAVKTDSDGDGVADTHAVGCETFMWNFICSNGGNVFTGEDGTLDVADFNAPQVVEAMDFCARFHAELGDAVFPYECIELFQYGGLAMGVLEFWNAQKFSGVRNGIPMADEYGWVPFPCGPSADGAYYSYGKEQSLYFMPATVKEPQDVAWVFNAITDYAQTDAQWNEWVRSIVATWALSDTKLVDNVMEIALSDRTVINPLVGYDELYDVVQEMFDEITAGHLTAQEALDSYSPTIASAMEQTDASAGSA